MYSLLKIPHPLESSLAPAGDVRVKTRWEYKDVQLPNLRFPPDKQIIIKTVHKISNEWWFLLWINVKWRSIFSDLSHIMFVFVAELQEMVCVFSRLYRTVVGGLLTKGLLSKIDTFLLPVNSICIFFIVSFSSAV